ncbi:hypothetical protein [Streptomyces sp. TRM68367]|uniref:hypothetical protein n=1 Tax=Streptomyces sp. TRM68367 TaxID=2758415 RepID=UPI00165A457F|nr:hypothetical protein [Streptomyces sp. TRM68367]MBC9726513.1 hypothetical protein [Streptomyces sp. TRM68367]
MPTRTLPGAFAALAAIASGTALAAPDGAAPASPRSPAFLSPGELPPHPTSSWTAGEVTEGVPQELRLCLGDELPAHGHRYSRYREFRTAKLR